MIPNTHNKSRVVYLIFLLIISFFNFSFEKAKVNAKFLCERLDTVYVVIVKDNLTNGRPIQNLIITKNLDIFKKAYTEVNTAEFLCKLFKESVLFEDPFFTIYKNPTLLKLNAGDKETYLNNLSKKIKILNKSYSKDIPLHLKDQTIHIQIAKFIGTFWIIKGNIKSLNDYSESFDISEDCYSKDFKYNLKSIFKVVKLTHEGKIMINN